LAAATISDTHAQSLSTELEIDSSSTSRFGEALLFLVNNLHRINVSTLDAYFAKLLSNHAYELGVGALWSIATPRELAEQKQRAIVELLDQLTDTESARLMRFINKGKYNRSILGSLGQTISSLISPFYQSTAAAWSSDLREESACQLLTSDQISSAIDVITLLMENDECVPFIKTLTTDLATLRADDWDTAIKGGLFKKILGGERTFSRKPLPDCLVDAYLPLTKHVVALKILELENQTSATFSILSKYADILNRIKCESNRLEFGDVPRFLGRGERNFESSFRMDGTIAHLLLDEFQDTSLPQWNIVEPLAFAISQQHDSSFFCVGDVKQAIYGWRGGRREIFDRLESSLSSISCDTLEQSYRSSRVVVEFVNTIFSNLDAHPNPSVHADTLGHWQKDFVALTPVLKHDGYVEYINAEVGNDKNERLQCCLRLAAEKTEMLLAANREMQIGILVRTNDSIATLMHLLTARGIACSEDGGNPLSNYSAVQLVLSALSLIEHPENSVAQFHVYHSPLADMFGYDAESSKHKSACDASLRFRQLFAANGFQSVLNELVLMLEPHVDTIQFTRLEHLLVFADAYTFSRGFRLDEFIQAVEKERFSEPEAARVRVMTIHQSKGLEFDAVILPTLESTLAPRAPTYAVTRNTSTQEITDVFMYRNIQIQELLPVRYRNACKSTIAEYVNESLCVLYVSLTRAARALYIIGPCQPKSPKTPPLTSAGIIQMAIHNQYSQSPSSVVYSIGNHDWFEQLPAYISKPTNTAATLPVPLANESSNQPPPLSTASPSSLEGGDRFLLSGVLRSPSATALLFGSQLHYFMEQIEWAQGLYWEKATELFTIKYGSISDELQSHIAMFNENGPLALILNTNFYFEDMTSPLRQFDEPPQDAIHFSVHNEYPICATMDGNLLRGFIDRLVVMRVDQKIVAVDICDYKTDRVHMGTDELKARVSHYRPQIRAYRKAIAQMFALEPSQIGSRLIFTNAGVQVSV
jgi:ATP-dependent helicase/nuclease subunit A